MRAFIQLQSTRVFSPRGMSASWRDQSWPSCVAKYTTVDTERDHNIKCIQNGDIPHSLPAKNSSIRLAQALHYGHFSTTIPLPPTGDYQNNRSFSQMKSQSHKQHVAIKKVPVWIPPTLRTKVQNEGVTLDPVETNKSFKTHIHRSPTPHCCVKPVPQTLGFFVSIERVHKDRTYD